MSSAYPELQQAPAAALIDDIWARLCCEQALLAAAEGCYPVGAVLVNDRGELVAEARNQVFAGGYHSGAHAEMQVLDRFESSHGEQSRSGLTLYVSLEPCLMCCGRILLSGITRVRYLASDVEGGMASQLTHLPPAWQALASRVSFASAHCQPFWSQLAAALVRRRALSLREEVLLAWQGRFSEHP